MATKDCYEQSASSWMNEWADNDTDNDTMTDEEREVAENAARVEIAEADSEAAEYRQREREQMSFSCLSKIEIDMDAPF